VDYLGTIAFAPAIAAVLLGINKSGAWGWTDAKTLGLIVGGLVVLALWVLWELRVTDPIVNVRLFTDRKVALTMCATLAIAVGPMGISTMIIPMILQSPTTSAFGLGISPTNAGWLSFVGSLFGFVCTPLSGRITRAVGSRASMLLGTALFVASSAMMLVLHESVAGMVAMIITVSIGTAFAYTALPNLIVEAVPEGNTSEATGTNAVLRTGGQGIGTSIATMLLASSATAAGPTVTGLNMVGGLMIVAGLLTIGFTLLIRRGSVYAEA